MRIWCCNNSSPVLECFGKIEVNINGLEVLPFDGWTNGSLNGGQCVNIFNVYIFEWRTCLSVGKLYRM